MALTQINSEGIKDGEIKNADLDSSAAIAGSKLAAATTSAAGSMSAADKTKLDGVATSATANPSAPALTGSTNNTITTVTGANAIQGEANLTFDGNNLELGPAGDARLILHSDTDTNSSAGIVLMRGANDTYGADGYTDYTILSEGGHLIFTSKVSGNSDEERLRIDSNGKLLLGTTTEGHADADDFTIASSGHTGLSIRSGTSNNGNIFFSDGTSGNAEIRGYIQYDHTNNRMYFGANATHEVSILNGGGISFNGDTAAANALDDYEEGTWTPDFYYHSSVANVAGHYTKIGRMVYAYFTGNYYSTASDGQYISNLPFVSSNDSGGNGGVARGYQNYDIVNGPIYFIENNTTRIWFYKDNGVAMPASDGNGMSFRGVAIYHTSQ